MNFVSMPLTMYSACSLDDVFSVGIAFIVTNRGSKMQFAIERATEMLA